MTGAGYRVEQFSLSQAEPAALARLISEVFEHHGKDTGGSIAFDDATFRLIFPAPGADPELFVRVTEGGELVGFLGGIPRVVSVRGAERRMVVPAWASVHHAHQRRGLALEMGSALLRIARERGYDGGVAMFEPEAHGIDTARSVMRREGLALSEWCRVKHFLIRILDVDAALRAASLGRIERLALGALERAPEPESRRVRLLRADDHGRVFELCRDHLARNDVAMVRERDELSWYLSQPDVVTVVHEDDRGEVDGFLSAWRMLLAGFGNRVPFGWLDLVHVHRLPGREARDLTRGLCLHAGRRGWAGLQMPHLPYFGATPLWRARFVPYPKQLIVAAVSFDAPLPPRPRGVYLDWR